MPAGTPSRRATRPARSPRSSLTTWRSATKAPPRRRGAGARSFSPTAPPGRTSAQDWHSGDQRHLLQLGTPTARPPICSPTGACSSSSAAARTGSVTYNISSNLMRVTLNLVGSAPVANFSGTPTSGHAAVRHLHRQLDQQPDRLVLDLRRLQHLHGAEPEPHLQQRGLLHRGPDRHQCGWQQHQHEDQLHHRQRRRSHLRRRGRGGLRHRQRSTPRFLRDSRPTTSCCCSWRRPTRPSASPTRTAAPGRKSPTRRRASAPPAGPTGRP